MKKIATPVELQSELKCLLRYAASANPSRARIARALYALSDRLESRTASDNAIVVFDDDALKDLGAARKGWKGYVYKMTYEVWNEEAVDAGETDDKGWEENGSEDFDTLNDLLRDIDNKCSWTYWSNNGHPNSDRDWISGEEENMNTGETTYYHMWIQRKDKKVLDRREVAYINKHLHI